MRYRIPADVAWQESPPEHHRRELYICRLPDGRPIVLADSACDIWLLAAMGENVVATLTSQLDIPADTIATDVASFLTSALALGILEEAAPPDPELGAST